MIIRPKTSDTLVWKENRFHQEKKRKEGEQGIPTSSVIQALLNKAVCNEDVRKFLWAGLKRIKRDLQSQSALGRHMMLSHQISPYQNSQLTDFHKTCLQICPRCVYFWVLPWIAYPMHFNVLNASIRTSFHAPFKRAKPRLIEFHKRGYSHHNVPIHSHYSYLLLTLLTSTHANNARTFLV